MHFRPLSLIILAVIVAFTGCSKPQIRALTPQSTILAFGDSLTAGYGVAEEDSYPSILSALLGLDVINEGISGNDTEQGLRRLPEALETHQPDLVILCIGGNDMLRKYPTAQTEKNLAEMIEHIHTSGGEVLLVGVPKPGLLLRVPEFYEALATQYDLPYDDARLPKILATNRLKSDAIHPNAAGYQLMAEQIYQRIQTATP